VPKPAPEKRGISAGAAVAIAIIVALITSLFVGGVAGAGGAWMASQGVVSTTTSGSGTVRLISGDTDEPVSAAAAVALPTVVNIDVSGEPIEEGEEMLPEGHPGVPRSGNGSGVAFMRAEDGGTYIITNAHVIDDASSIIVTTTDGERHRGEIVGADIETDVGVVKVDAELPLVDIGDSQELEVGQLVVAIGSPYGLSHSVSSGVVSALGRAIIEEFNAPEGTYPLVDAIQTDAAINPGNSGGALVDREGLLVGINSAIYSDSGASAGIGFAIPVNTAVSVAEQLITDGTVDHPFLGVVGRTVDPALASEEGLPVEEGAWVLEVTEGTGADDAGVQADDIIVGLDDEEVRSMDDLILYVRRTAVGEEVTLTLWRDGEKIEVIMVVGQKPENLEIPDFSEEASPVVPMPDLDRDEE
jgi:putative serine protease PepD